jgi:putative endonuclease
MSSRAQRSRELAQSEAERELLFSFDRPTHRSIKKRCHPERSAAESLPRAKLKGSCFSHSSATNHRSIKTRCHPERSAAKSRDLLFITFGIETIQRSLTRLSIMPNRCYYTYIVASRSRTLYIGVTSNIEIRIAQHKRRDYDGFTATYGCNRLVWFERYTSASAAIAREKQLKNWSRAKKIWLVERENPTWVDLSLDWGKPISAFQAKP